MHKFVEYVNKSVKIFVQKQKKIYNYKKQEKGLLLC